MMEPTLTASAPVQTTRPEQPVDRAGIQRLPLAALGRTLIAASLIALFFIADIVLPRGATAAIGYCLVPVILGRSRWGLLLGATALCTGLTAAGYWWEQPGAEAWMSIFDRIMVGGVLWLTFVLVRHRAIFVGALIEQTGLLKTITTELGRSNADLERFASTVAHDLRGPLGTVGLLAQLLGRSGSVKADAEAVEFVGSIESELKRMSDFIQSLLVYGRAGAREIEPVECDCEVVLKNVKQSLLAEIDRHGARLTSNPLPRMRADPVLIGQLFQNLIENSLKYHGEAPPMIQISRATQRDGSWRFSVQDNGTGIREEDRERIFTPFYRANQANAAAPGVGLGLATCKRIVERHGGRIWVESKPGAGTTFFFTIAQPVAEHDAANALALADVQEKGTSAILATRQGGRF